MKNVKSFIEKKKKKKIKKKLCEKLCEKSIEMRKKLKFHKI